MVIRTFFLTPQPPDPPSGGAILCVFLRRSDIPVPGMYDPSGDDIEVEAPPGGSGGEEDGEPGVEEEVHGWLVLSFFVELFTDARWGACSLIAICR